MCIFRIPSLYKSKILIQILKKRIISPENICIFTRGLDPKTGYILYTEGWLSVFFWQRFLMCLKAPSKMAACSVFVCSLSWTLSDMKVQFCVQTLMVRQCGASSSSESKGSYQVPQRNSCPSFLSQDTRWLPPAPETSILPYSPQITFLWPSLSSNQATVGQYHHLVTSAANHLNLKIANHFLKQIRHNKNQS